MYITKSKQMFHSPLPPPFHFPLFLMQSMWLGFPYGKMNVIVWNSIASDADLALSKLFVYSSAQICGVLYFLTCEFLLCISKPGSLLRVSGGDTAHCYEGQIPRPSLFSGSQNQALHRNYHWVGLLLCLVWFSIRRWCIWNKWAFLKPILVVLPSCTWSYVALHQMHVTKEGSCSHSNGLLLFLSSQGNFICFSVLFFSLLWCTRIIISVGKIRWFGG